MTKHNKLEPGDRVAYAAKFLKNIAAHTGSMPQRRGTFASYYDREHARVKWDDFDFDAAAAQYGDDYAEDARKHGQLVNIHNIAKVGSPRFASNDL